MCQIEFRENDVENIFRKLSPWVLFCEGETGAELDNLGDGTGMAVIAGSTTTFNLKTQSHVTTHSCKVCGKG